MSDGSDKLWSVRGIPDDVRETASQAAKAQSVPIGQWVSHAIRQTAASDRGGMAGEVVSDTPSDTPPDRSSLEVVAMLLAGLGQVSAIKGNGGIAERIRVVIDQHLAGLALAPLPKRQASPKRIAAPVSDKASPNETNLSGQENVGK